MRIGAMIGARGAVVSTIWSREREFHDTQDPQAYAAPP
jgi:hypothetical protein